MRPASKISIGIIVLIMLCGTQLPGQEKKQNYGNIPDDLVAFDRYMKAYKYHFLTPTQFYGAGREKPAPVGLKEVRIGFLGPLEGSIISELGKQMLQGAQMAVDDANGHGGYKGIPYRLMIHNDVGLWGAAANEVVKMDDEGVWGWLGSIDDIVSHVAIRATLKLEIVNVNSGDPDPTFTETNIPWVIRVIPDDRQSSYVLVNQIINIDKHKRIAMIRANNRYGRVGTLHFNRTSTRIGVPILIEERFADGDTDFTSQIERVKRVSPDAIAIWGNADQTAMILKQLRAAGLNQPVYTSDRVVSDAFLKLAGPLAEDVFTTCQYNPDSNDPKLKTFQANYTKKFGIKPDVFAAYAYDGMSILIDATRKAGLNRVLIRDLLTDMKTYNGYEGVTGKIVFDQTWNNIKPIFVARVKNGKFEFSPAPPLEPVKVIYKHSGDRY